MRGRCVESRVPRREDLTMPTADAQGAAGEAASLSCRDADVAAFRIDEPCQHPAEILLCGRHAESDAFGSHYLVELLQVRDADAELDSSGRVLFRRGIAGVMESNSPISP